MKNLLIAVDYDGTYSEDPKAFDHVITEFESHGHECIIVTARDEKVSPVVVNTNLGLKIYYTSGQLKDPYLQDNHSIRPDIWIEDRPQSVGRVDDWLFHEETKRWYKECGYCDENGKLLILYGSKHEEATCNSCNGEKRLFPE